MLPSDVDAQSRCRLPLVRREDLDEEGRKAYDTHRDPAGGTLRGLRGPGGIGLHSPKFSQLNRAVLRYFRDECVLPARLRELAILVAAREANSRFEWAAHEPEAQLAGVPANTLAAVRRRLPLAGLENQDAIVIQLGREALGAHHVTSATYAQAHQLLGTRLLVDLVALMGYYTSAAALLAVFDMQLDDGETHLLPLP